VDDAPPVDGSVDGFDTSEPLTLDLEDQYRRSEEGYPGPDDFAARAYVAWDERCLFVAVDVTKVEPLFRPADAPPLRLDNEPDDIHSDGVQLYVGHPEGRGFAGVLVVPEAGGGVRVRPVEGTDAAAAARIAGAWQRTDAGYCVTLAWDWPDWLAPHVGGLVGFDLIVNEMQPDRERRAGQLAWTGGNGWVWLRGDRQSPERLGVLELVG
jgi:hypothetical protein